MFGGFELGGSAMENVKKELLGLSDYAFQRLTNRLEGLTDDEYLWEPASDCWTIRPNSDGTFRGDGGLIFDEIPPVTTIAWRFSHIIDCLAAERCARLLGLEPEPHPLEDGFPGTAAAASELLGRAYDLWRGYLTTTDDAGLRSKLGAAAAPYQDETRVGFVLHILDELIHHGAEVALLRDLYRAERTHDPFVAASLQADRETIEKMRRADAEIVGRTLAAHPDLMLRAAAGGRWEAIPLLAELGFSIEGKDGRTPLHHAAAGGRLDTMRFLVDRGADTTVSDPVYKATPLEWAEYFNRREAADYLRSLTTSSA